jgi:tetratricopeptide (TPR) repeat protein
MDPLEIDDLVRDLQSRLNRPLPFAQRTAPALDSRNVVRKVIEAYLADRRINSSPVLAPLIEIVRMPNANAEHALFDLAMARDLFERIRDHEGIAIAVGTMGNVYASVAAFPEALECYARTMALYANLNDVRGMQRCASNIGTVQAALPTFTNALEVLTESMQLLQYADRISDTEITADLRSVFLLLGEALAYMEQHGATTLSFSRRTTTRQP